MNYMEKVAKMFGVEIGEEFELEGDICKYKFDKECGLLQYCDDSKGWKCVPFSLLGILTGMANIKRKPFKPEYDDYYFSVNIKGNIECHVFYCNEVDYYRLNSGNCFRTKEEITDEMKQEIIKKVKGKYESEE